MAVPTVLPNQRHSHPMAGAALGRQVQSSQRKVLADLHWAPPLDMQPAPEQGRVTRQFWHTLSEPWSARAGEFRRRTATVRAVPPTLARIDEPK